MLKRSEFDRCTVALERARAALVGLQRADGTFPVMPNPSRPPVLRLDPIFSTACVLEACCNQLPSVVVDAALGYIESRRLRDGLWEWSGCPADADDSALCTAALVHGRGRHIANAAVLRRFWRTPSGPFQTWRPGAAFKRVPDDPVVNCNLLYCLRLVEGRADAQEEEAVTQLVLDCLTRVPHYSEYYWSLSTLVYAAARAQLRQDVISLIGRAALTHALTPQGVAEVMAGLPELSPRLVARLLDAQRPDGHWVGEPWFFDPAGDFCSDAYATAVAMEAVAACQK